MALLLEIPAVAPVRVSDPPLATCRPVAAALSPIVSELVVPPPRRIAVLIWTGVLVARSMMAVSAALLGNTPLDQFAPRFQAFEPEPVQVETTARARTGFKPKAI